MEQPQRPVQHRDQRRLRRSPALLAHLPAEPRLDHLPDGFEPLLDPVDPVLESPPPAFQTLLEAAGHAADVYDIDANDRTEPHHLGVLSHYDAVVWESGDDIVPRALDHPGGTADDWSLTVELSIRDYLNEGGKVLVAGPFEHHHENFERLILDADANAAFPQFARARMVAHGMGLPHLTLDLRAPFREGVVDPFELYPVADGRKVLAARGFVRHPAGDERAEELAGRLHAGQRRLGAEGP